jgi:Domain of unknown function (DU1801)
MAELKTKVNEGNVDAFIESIEKENIRQDCVRIMEIMREITQSEPKMWGGSIVGFGNYHYKYASGREGDWFIAGFSPRKQNITMYIIAGFTNYEEILNRLGKYKTGKSCLYINKLSDIDLNVLQELVRASVEHLQQGGTPNY